MNDDDDDERRQMSGLVGVHKFLYFCTYINYTKRACIYSSAQPYLVQVIQPHNVNDNDDERQR